MLGHVLYCLQIGAFSSFFSVTMLLSVSVFLQSTNFSNVDLIACVT